jgi:hypothetical protein
MENIYYLLLLAIFCWYFVYLRNVAEAATRHVQEQCKQSKLQFISMARRSTQIKFTKKNGLHFFSIFDFEFSGDGESSYNGILSLNGLKLSNVELPPYRV